MGEFLGCFSSELVGRRMSLALRELLMQRRFHAIAECSRALECGDSFKLCPRDIRREVLPQDAMNEAVEQHHTLVRKLLRKFSG